MRTGWLQMMLPSRMVEGKGGRREEGKKRERKVKGGKRSRRERDEVFSWERFGSSDWGRIRDIPKTN